MPAPVSFDLPCPVTVDSEMEYQGHRLSIINRYRHQNSLTGYTGPFGLEVDGEEWVLIHCMHRGYTADRERAHKVEEIKRGTEDEIREAIRLIELGTV